MEVSANYGFILLAMTVAFGFFMAWGVGANDVANAMGTSVGSKAITFRQAIIIAVVFEFAGAYLAGGEVTSMAFLIELAFLEGRKHLPGFDIHSLLQY